MENFEKISGVIVLDKSKDITSRKELDKLSRILKKAKTGHIGTLDPITTGVLPAFIGSACKLSKYYMMHDKTYEVEFKLGTKTDTLDITGNILTVNGEEEIQKVLKDKIKIISTILSFEGKYIQTPPIYSARKIDGKKLYEIARKDIQKALEFSQAKQKEVEIYSICDIQIIEDKISFTVSVSSGTYIRSLIYDICQKLGIYGVMTKLCRTKAGAFSIKEAVNIQRLESLEESEILKEIIPTEKILYQITKNEFNLQPHRYKAFLNGLTTRTKEKEGIYIVKLKNVVIGLGSVKNGELKKEYLI